MNGAFSGVFAGGALVCIEGVAGGIQTVNAWTGNSIGWGGGTESVRGYVLGNWNLYENSHSSEAKFNKKVHLGPFRRITVSGFGYWAKRGTRGSLWICLHKGDRPTGVGSEYAYTDYVWPGKSSDSDYDYGYYKNACAASVSIDVSKINEARGISINLGAASSGSGPGPFLITSVRFER